MADHVASEWIAHHGTGLLPTYASSYEFYTAIKSPQAWSAVQEHFPHPPRHLEFDQGMGEVYLDGLLPGLPN